MSWADRGNSPAAWDEAFAPGGHWDQIDGSAITAAFGELLLRLLPEQVRAYLSEGGHTVLDWGCARGEMTHVLRRAFPRAVVVGQDRSALAVSQAVALHGHPFRIGDAILGAWDVVVVSNVLEHLRDPLGTAQAQMRHTNAYYLALSPYEEPLGPGEGLSPEQRERAGHAHLHRFGLATFPPQLGGWERLGVEVGVPGPAWPGRQMLVTYGRG